MKKNFKLFSILLSLIMVLSSSATVFAAETEDIPPAIEMDVSVSPNGLEDGLVTAKTIYNNSTFTFHHSNYGNAFYARKGEILIEVRSTAASGYANAPLAKDLCKSNRESVDMGIYHKGTDSWSQRYTVPADGYYCFHYFNGVPSGDYYNFAQTITISAYNIYSLVK